MTSSTTTTDPTAPGSAEPTPFARSVIGIVVFSRTIAAVRYAKDAGKAPTLDARLALLRMSADAVASCEEARRLGAASGIDPVEAAAGYLGALGEVDERLRPLDWSERLVKTYLAVGLLSDFAGALVDELGGDLSTGLRAVIGADDFGAFASAELMGDLDADPLLAGRLGLWGRRVVGEEIGTFRRLQAERPVLLSGGATSDGLHEVLSEGATSRMRSLGLRV
ncbi:ferritin-like fold-containing protein [Actinomyces radicidentis]|uniref:ferritin-like fold-containing protein n=1 Tax=Actinomyces radicidentis TaxID=111015 RepID=UPI0026E0A721|nr:ferritin-like fold-containing protein [Actinomyces radicidentis]